MSEPLVITMTGRAGQHQTQTYMNVPFEVPEGTARIDVSYSYSDQIGSDPHLTNGNTVDIGIFDTRGAGFMPQGFRGWTGSARNSFFLGIDESTPGYLTGPIQPGTWNINLGFYKIAPQGCDYQVEIRLTPGDHAGEAAFPAFVPLRETTGRLKADGWYCGDLHCHTYHSDGDSDPLEVVKIAETLGLDFLAITDHNNVSHLARLNEAETPLILIPGFEVTTYKGHWNVWGDHGWIDFRVERESQMAQAVAEAKQRGYVVSCNHPKPFGPDWVYTNVDDVHSIEVWNGPWVGLNEISLEYWESRLRAGKRYTAVCGSDCHFHHREHRAKFAQPTLWLYCEGEPSAPKLLEALVKGRATLSASQSSARLTLSVGDVMMGGSVPRPADGQLALTAHVQRGAGQMLEFHTAAGCVHAQSIEGTDARLDVPINVSVSPYVRAQIVAANTETRDVQAISNPIYIDA